MSVDVELVLAPWAGDRAVAADEARALAIVDVTVNGVELSLPSVSVDADGFFTLTITDPPRKLRDQFSDPATHLLGTDEKTLVIAATSLQVRTQE